MIFMHIYPYAVLYYYLPLAEVGIFSTEIKFFYANRTPLYSNCNITGFFLFYNDVNGYIVCVLFFQRIFRGQFIYDCHVLCYALIAFFDDDGIASAILSISSVFMPLDVTDGVPRRIPLVTNGDFGSFGIVFLLAVI
mgnify:CR=1 FL=1